MPVTQATLANQRLTDPVLTELAQGYDNNELVGEALMPVVEIDKEAGKIPVFGRLAFRLKTTTRQLRGNSNRLTPEGLKSIDVALEEHDVEYPIDYREENDACFALRQYALNTTQDIIALGREKEIATLAQDESKYEATNKIVLEAKTQLTHKESNVFAVIDKGIQTIARTIGRRPNVCVIAGDVWAVLKEHPSILEKIKYAQKAIVTPELFAELIGIKTVKIGQAVSAGEADDTLTDIWTNTIVLAYVPEKNQARGNVYEPSYGYTVRRKGGLFVDTYKEAGGKIEVVRTTDIHKPHLVGAAAGYLITKCIK